VRWKGFTAESDTWEGKENLENTKEAIKEFEREYQWDIEKVNRQKKEEGMFKREELPGRFMVKKLFGWSDKKYDKEYWGSVKYRAEQDGVGRSGVELLWNRED